MWIADLAPERLHAAGPNVLPVIVITGFATVETAIEAMKQGAYDFISKPFKPDEVLLTLKKAEERESLKRENRWQIAQARCAQLAHVGNEVEAQHFDNAKTQFTEYLLDELFPVRG